MACFAVHYIGGFVLDDELKGFVFMFLLAFAVLSILFLPFFVGVVVGGFLCLFVGVDGWLVRVKRDEEVEDRLKRLEGDGEKG